MKHLSFIFTLFLLTVFAANYSYGQNIEDSIVLTGKVVDENDEPVYIAWVYAKVKDRVLGRGFTDSSGNYLFKVNRTYSSSFYINVSSWGYLEHRVINIPFTDVLIDFDIIKLTPRRVEPIEIITQCPPIFDIYGSGNTKTITSEELEQMGH